MSRPANFKVDATIYWTLATYDADGILVDADSTPTVAVRKNGSSVVDVVTVAKRAATTGLYDCSYNPASEAEGDCFTLEESATVSSQAYLNAWSIEALAAERGTDGANTVVPNTVVPDNTSIASILADTNELQTNQGQWLTATGFNTVAPDNASIASILADTNELQSNQGQWLTATGFSTFDHTADAVITDTASRDASKADVSGLSTFDSTTDQVVASNMRGTDGANTVVPNTIAPDNASITSILADTADLQSNQGQWLTATGFSTFDSATDAVITDTASRDASKADVSSLSTFDPSTDQVVASNMRGTDGANTVVPNTVAPDNASISAILADTADLQANQSQWLTANVSGLASQASVDTLDANVDTLVANQGDWATADVSGLLTTSGYNASLPANFSTLVIGTAADLGKVTTSNPAAGSGSSHTAQDVANLILATPANLLATDASGDVTANNMRGTDGANTVAPVDVSSSVALILADTSDLQSNQNNWLTATTTVSSNMRGTDNANTVAPVDVSGAIAALNDFNPAVDTVAHVTLVDTTTDLTNQSSGGTNPSDIYTYFTDGTREDAFKADTSGLSTFDPASDTVARVTLVDTTTDLTNSLAGGDGLYQATVRVQDTSGDSLQGARVNIDGTTITSTTGTSGEVTFNLDSGVYLLEVSPPAGYDTPTGKVLTVSTSDAATTAFTLSSTSPPTGCDIPWLG